MNTITRITVLLMLSVAFATVMAQEVKIDSLQNNATVLKIEALNKLKAKIEREERDFLKAEITAINDRLDNGKITAAEAEDLKKDAAQKRALNIENRLAIIDNKIALLERNPNTEMSEDGDGTQIIFRIGGDEESNESFIYLGEKSEDKPRKYDRRTTSDMVFAIGFNNALIEGQSLDDTPYKLGGSGFVEIGYAWKTRLLQNSNFLRLKYGFSFQWNKLDTKDDEFFVNNNGNIELQEFPGDINKSKFRTTNLVFPVHLEFGPSKKKEYDTYYRYTTYNQLKFGIGGYAGFNIASLQKLKYEVDGDRVKEKQRGGLEVSELIYGVSGYIALGDVALYVKYDLNPIFKNQDIDQNNISVGLRFDMD